MALPNLVIPNIFAILVFYSWPLIVYWMVSRYKPKKAIFMAITLAILLLPNDYSFDLPMVPPIDRSSLTSVSLAIILFFSGKRFQIFPSSLPSKIIIGFLVSIFITSMLNSDYIALGHLFIPGLTYYDALSETIRAVLLLMPYFLGRAFLNDVKDNESIFKLLVVFALFYSILMLGEIRLSPNFQFFVYGYSTIDFLQQIREGGYRPTVFFGHGLGLAFWLSTCITAALALRKNKVRIGMFSASQVVIYLIIVLVLSKTWSALVYAFLAMFLLFNFVPYKQIKWSLILVAIMMLYPVTKTFDIFPDKEIVSNIQQYSYERAQSLEFRFQNEDILLEKALQKPFFGWGGWGRARVYDKTGRDISVTDGKWIIDLGNNGSIGFILIYSLYFVTLLYSLRTVNYIQDQKHKVYFSSLAIILAICVIDSIPNTGMVSMHLMLAGALLGQAESLKRNALLIIEGHSKNA